VNDTVEEVFQRLSQIKGHAEQTLQRCQNAPYPSIERTRKVGELLEEAKTISDRAARLVRDLEGPARVAFEASQQELRDKQQELAQIDRQITDQQQILQARQVEHNANVKAARTKNQDPNELNNAWTVFTREHQAKTSTLTAERTELQAQVNELANRGRKQQEQLNAEIARARAERAPEELVLAEAEMASVLDRAGVLERQIASGANLELVKEAKTAFRDKTGDFSDAESYHRRQAHSMLAVMLLVSVVAGVAIYYLFVAHAPPPASAGQAPPEAGLGTLVAIERAVVLATGRVAILLFLAWTVRYLAGLHSAHSEQAIVYRDRRAALGVAELLLNATPELDQKREMLRTLTGAYLTIDRKTFGAASATTSVAAARESGSGSGSGTDYREQLKELLRTVEPLLDLVRKTGNRG
jgi:hypothetical protein